MNATDRPWEPADLPAETVREARAVSRELALDSALRGLLEAIEALNVEALTRAIATAKATREGVRDARRHEGWSG